MLSVFDLHFIIMRNVCPLLQTLAMLAKFQNKLHSAILSKKPEPTKEMEEKEEGEYEEEEKQKEGNEEEEGDDW